MHALTQKTGLVALLATSLQGAVPIPGDQLDISGFEKYAYKSFTNRSNQEQNLYVYACKPDGWKTSDARSAIIFIHGGGYINGDPTEDTQYCRHFSGRGMVTFTIEYRIASRDATDAEKTNWNFWKPRSDCIEAIRWIRSRAAQFGIAPDKIVVGGWSAGVDASMTASFGSKCVPSGFTCGDPTVSCVPNAIFLWNGALIESLDWYKTGDSAPPVLALKGDREHVMPSPRVVTRQFFDTVFAKQPHKEIRVYRSDFGMDGSTNYEATHICFLTGTNASGASQRYALPVTIDLEEWLASLGYLPERTAPLLVESNGFCRFDAMDFSERSPRILQNHYQTLTWQISSVKDASRGYLMDCVPPSAETMDDAALSKAPRLDYRVTLSTPGNYYVWANLRASWEASHKGGLGRPEGPFYFRCKQLKLGVSDGAGERLIHGRLQSTSDGSPSWQCANTDDPIVVKSPGEITLKAYGVSAGIRLEQIVLTTDPSYTPPAIPAATVAAKTSWICPPPDEHAQTQDFIVGGLKNPAQIPKLAEDFTLDGDPGKWDAIQPLPAPYEKKDTGSVKLAWVKAGLYGCIRMEDCPTNGTNHIAKLAHAIELWFEMDLARDEIIGPNTCQLALAPDPAAHNHCAVRVLQGSVNAGSIQAIWKETATGGIIEFFMPSAELKKTAMREGSKLGFHYAVNQGGKAVEQFFCDKNEDDHYAAPSAWGVIQLAQPTECKQ